MPRDAPVTQTSGILHTLPHLHTPPHPPLTTPSPPTPHYHYDHPSLPFPRPPFLSYPHHALLFFSVILMPSCPPSSPPRPSHLSPPSSHRPLPPRHPLALSSFSVIPIPFTLAPQCPRSPILFNSFLFFPTILSASSPPSPPSLRHPILPQPQPSSFIPRKFFRSLQSSLTALPFPRSPFPSRRPHTLPTTSTMFPSPTISTPLPLVLLHHTHVPQSSSAITRLFGVSLPTLYLLFPPPPVVPSPYLHPS